MKTAKLLSDKLPAFRGHAALYELSHPITDWEDRQHSHVVVSSVDFVGPETYIFASNSQGDVTEWGELPGSQKGTLSHDDVLADAGYSIIR